MIRTVGATEAIEEMVKAIIKHGANHEYTKPAGEPACLYVHENGPGCIVGEVLLALGVPRSVLEGCSQDIDVLAPQVATETGVKLTPAAIQILRYVQAEQDSHTPWGEALANGLRRWREDQRYHKLTLD